MKETLLPHKRKNCGHLVELIESHLFADNKHKMFNYLMNHDFLKLMMGAVQAGEEGGAWNESKSERRCKG